ncbi:metalloproteinase inhibitor 3-like [Crassostrea virginica]|uniref:Metalloproteinase inhibitor 3-like n=1 Tax=Crassostrea virginica TaxID=6565 RepID=A0A8B8AZ24_CRAVI|nr:metalloproteinase inhibitor 3-like [Crassostrea virginica]
MKAVLFLFVVLASVYTYTEACTCLPQHPQQQFCNADFVIKAKILKRKQTNADIFSNVIYTVKILQDYKNHKGQYKQRTQNIYTASNSAACGSFFEIGKEYIITGSIRDGRWSTNLCRWNPQVSLLSSYQKDALRFGFYKKNCKCEIKECFGNTCPPADRNSCVIKKGADIRCFYSNNSCSRQGYGCGWRTSACI